MNNPKNARVLLVYGELLEYRTPIFSQLGEKSELTVTLRRPEMTESSPSVS